MEKEKIIVSLTTYYKRIGNLPVVLDTIFAQTMPPDLVVLNLAYDEEVPDDVQRYIDEHQIEVNRVFDTKVYKKLIPTLKKYPDDCVISIDDDFLYPSGMIEDFMTIHRQYPHFPISGNKEMFNGLQCHCGCASLMKLCYFGTYVGLIDEDLISHCMSDDLVYTFLVNMNGHPYIRTQGLYFENMKSYNSVESYSISAGGADGIYNTYNYLIDRFGPVDLNFDIYAKVDSIASIVVDTFDNSYQLGFQRGQAEGYNDIYSSVTFKVGYCVLNPFRILKKMLDKTWKLY